MITRLLPLKGTRAAGRRQLLCRKGPDAEGIGLSMEVVSEKGGWGRGGVSEGRMLKRAINWYSILWGNVLCIHTSVISVCT